MQGRTYDRRAERLTLAAEFHKDIGCATREELTVGLDEHAGVGHIHEHGSRGSRKAHLNVVSDLRVREAGGKASFGCGDRDVVGGRLDYMRGRLDDLRGRVDQMRGERPVMRGDWLVHVIGYFEIEHELLEIDLHDQRIQVEIGAQIQGCPYLR